MKITVNNPRKSRSFGFGYSLTPGKKAGSILPPHAPFYVGTINQVEKAIEADKTLRSLLSGGTFVKRAWFYKAKRILNHREFVSWLHWGYESNEPVEIEIEGEE